MKAKKIFFLNILSGGGGRNDLDTIGGKITS